MNSSSAIVVQVIGMTLAAILLHFGLCQWVLTPRGISERAWPRILWQVTTSEPLPSYPGDPRSSELSGRFLMTKPNVSIAEARVFGIVAPILLLSIVVARLLQIRLLRRQWRGWCLRCGYDLRFDVSRGCSECGWRGNWTSPRSD